MEHSKTLFLPNLQTMWADVLRNVRHTWPNGTSRFKCGCIALFGWSLAPTHIYRVAPKCMHRPVYLKYRFLLRTVKQNCVANTLQTNWLISNVKRIRAHGRTHVCLKLKRDLED
jgi:hypothetical protein